MINAISFKKYLTWMNIQRKKNGIWTSAETGIDGKASISIDVLMLYWWSSEVTQQQEEIRHRYS